MWILTIAILSSSCAGPKLESPGPDRQAILVLPVQVTNRTQHGKHGFYYLYDIAEAGTRTTVYQAIFKLPVRGDMLIVDSLSPGDYFVDKFIFKQVGSGNFTYGNNVQSRYDKFKLEAGKITLFSKSLNVLKYNRIPGRGMDITYDFRMEAVTPVQREEILATLKSLPGFEAWEISDNE